MHLRRVICKGNERNVRVPRQRSLPFRFTQQRKLANNEDGYKSIGSFHSENLSEILKREMYEPPPLPFEASALPSKDQGNRRHQDFMLDFHNWTFLNHGAFGAALRQGVNLSNDWRTYLEQQPLRFFDRDLLPHLAHSLIKLASFVNAPSRKNLTLLPNVTSGLNSVLSGHARIHGESAHCVLWDTTYGSVKKMASHFYHGRVTEIPFQAQSLSKLRYSKDPETTCVEEAMTLFERSLKDLNSETPLCFVLDHVTSNTALTMPIERIARSIKEKYRNSFVVVDGAHGMLAQEIDLKILFETGIDVYLSNGHKWLSAPRGVAFLATASDLSSSILRYPAVQSHGVDEVDIFSRFVWDGCRDYTAALVLPTVLDHWASPKRIRGQCRGMLRKGIQHLGNMWQADEGESEAGTLVDLESTMLCPMCLVAIPGARHGQKRTSAEAKHLQDNLFANNVEVPIKCINDKLFVRISCHVYNTEEDFDRLGTVLKDLTAI